MPVNKRWPLAELIATMEVGWLGRCWGHVLACLSGWHHAWHARKAVEQGTQAWRSATVLCASPREQRVGSMVPTHVPPWRPNQCCAPKSTLRRNQSSLQELFPKDKAAPRHGHHVLVAYTMLR